MLASSYRFHGHGSLRFVYSKGNIARSKYFICKTTTNNRRTRPRVAVVVSKKVMKSAVKRNRIRRRVYEVVRAELPNIEPRSDIAIIVVSPELLTAEFSDIANSLRGCFTQSHLYKTGES